MATYALVDGGLCTAQYLWSNGIRPAHILFSLKDLEEVLAYCDPEEDNILCIINGCVNIPVATVKELINLVDECSTIKKVTIFSNVPIYMANYQFPYILYDGDLMVGKEYEVDTSKRISHLTRLKPLPDKHRRIDEFKVDEATEDTVDIGEVPHKYIPARPDNANRDEILLIDIFKKKD